MMRSTVFHQLGPYVIHRAIGQGGMASVFYATDSRSGQDVALKIVHAGTDTEGKEILDAEQRGVELQKTFSQVSRFVPKVFESGFAADHYFIAMEYIEGEDLSHAIHRGPIEPMRAVAIARQLCEFLEEADRFETIAGSRRILLHNDLKPRNVRLMANDQIRVLDFGAAKSLSLSRKVTRNDFGSLAYLSPECLDSGERDRHTDAWALGVVLYEMLRGRPPFHAEDTRRLEQRIRSRQPPEPLVLPVPPALWAVVARMLAPMPEERYQSPAEIRADLDRFAAGAATLAFGQGWATRGEEPATRRTQPPVERETEPVTRPTRDPLPEGVTAPTRPAPAVAAGAAGSVAPTPVGLPAPAPSTVPPAAATAPVTTRVRWWRRRLGKIAIVVAIVLGVNESCVSTAADQLARRVPLQEFEGLESIWTEFDALAERSVLAGMGVGDLRDALVSHTLMLAYRVIADYRSPTPTVRENQWKAARDAVARALPQSDNQRLRAILRYCEGHLHRINGEAQQSRRQTAAAQQELNQAVIAFREAAAIDSQWPDPFLGLARTFLHGLDDVDRGADAFEQAKKRGHALHDREVSQLADGYRARAEQLERTAGQLDGLPQETEYLAKAIDGYKKAANLYATIADYGNSAASLRVTQLKLQRAELRHGEITRPPIGPPWE